MLNVGSASSVVDYGVSCTTSVVSGAGSSLNLMRSFPEFFKIMVLELSLGISNLALFSVLI